MMKSTIIALSAAATLAMLAPSSEAAVLVQYNIGSVNTAGETVATMQTPTSSADNLTTGKFTFGSTIATATNTGAGVASYYTTPGPNYLSVNNTSANSDNNAYIDISVAAKPGYKFTPTSLSITGGAGGSSNVRSFLVFDSVDGFPTSIAATSGSPTVTGGHQVGSTTAFTAVRSTGAAMNVFDIAFPAAVKDLTGTFEVRVYIDTQLNGQAKNIDLSNITLNGTVSPTPEPAAAGALGIGGILLGKRRRKSTHR